MIGSTVSGNAATFGGGIGNLNGNVTVEGGSVIANNTASGDGGGIQIVQDNSLPGTASVTVTDSTIVGNVTSGPIRGARVEASPTGAHGDRYQL